MKRISQILLFTSVLAGLAYGQAPGSVAGLTYRDDTYAPALNEIFTAIDFQSDGTYTTRAILNDNEIMAKLGYGSLAGGTYAYAVTAANQGAVTLTPANGSPSVLKLTFADGSQGRVARDQYQGNFSLLPTGGNPATRALVNISTLAYAKQGTPLTIGFVVGGNPAPNQSQLLNNGSPLREFLIRVVGPSLAAFGINNFAVNPVYFLNGPRFWFPGEQQPGFSSQPPPATDNAPLLPGAGWSASSVSAATIAAENVRAGAFALTAGSLDKADVVLLYPGAYTLTVNPLDASGEGMVLIEVYEVD